MATCEEEKALGGKVSMRMERNVVGKKIVVRICSAETKGMSGVPRD